MDHTAAAPHATRLAANLPSAGTQNLCKIDVNGFRIDAVDGENLIEAINRSGIQVPQVCFHTRLGPIQTCDTCMVEVDGKLVRACATNVRGGMTVVTETREATAAQREAYDRILANHVLYCTVCDNNNGNCTVHNTAAMLKVEHQTYPYRPKPYEVGSLQPLLPL